MKNNYISSATWETVENYLNAIAERIDPHEYVGVYGIPRGGSVLAAWLSHKLYLPLISEPKLNCIIIDDVCESGRTLQKCVEGLGSEARKDLFVTVMFQRPGSCEELIDFRFLEKGDNWVVFPWER